MCFGKVKYSAAHERIVTDLKLYFKGLKIVKEKKLTSNASMMDDSPYSSVNDSMTNLANDFLEVKTKSITKNAENFAMVLL